MSSGPYKVTNFQQGQLLQVEPHDGHWNTSEGNMSMKGERFKDEISDEILKVKNNIELNIRVEQENLEEVKFESL